MENVQKKEKKLRIVEGVVVSDKMNKTRVILVEKSIMHPLYKKVIKKSKRIKIHDENNETKVGDVVQAIETRPLSKEKRHVLFKILKKGEEQ
ncbi:MAG: 30S ribosomal protein S17 [Leptospiraceae bacterium]|nr:30S ribosomal protein S17 [Leptospiraceae bacterium]MDW7975180.1 30S ribosomal protein S17 [Leptospiraceae bacterium]